MEEVRATALDTAQYSAPSLQNQQAEVQSWHGAVLQESHSAYTHPVEAWHELCRGSESQCICEQLALECVAARDGVHCRSQMLQRRDKT